MQYFLLSQRDTAQNHRHGNKDHFNNQWNQWKILIFFTPMNTSQGWCIFESQFLYKHAPQSLLDISTVIDHERDYSLTFYWIMKYNLVKTFSTNYRLFNGLKQLFKENKVLK